MTVVDAIKRAQSKIPVDIFGLAHDLGVKINTVLFEGEDISGELVKGRNGSYQINVNIMHPPTRQRFTIAHELAHYIYHQDLIGDGVTDNRAYRSTQGSRYHNPNITAQHETEANRFAASVLMPLDAINDLRDQGLDNGRIAAALQVSEHALAIRLGVPYP